jgi:hypothetical protein
MTEKWNQVEAVVSGQADLPGLRFLAYRQMFPPNMYIIGLTFYERRAGASHLRQADRLGF